ncbi:Vacuolar fusion protein mon1b [Quaeritorhiza haematococci]|nr:Vacuolar fusion protein mon1b [Quaeritorhiza haematococci]
MTHESPPSGTLQDTTTSEEATHPSSLKIARATNSAAPSPKLTLKTPASVKLSIEHYISDFPFSATTPPEVNSANSALERISGLTPTTEVPPSHLYESAVPLTRVVASASTSSPGQASYLGGGIDGLGQKAEGWPRSDKAVAGVESDRSVGAAVKTKMSQPTDDKVELPNPTRSERGKQNATVPDVDSDDISTTARSADDIGEGPFARSSPTTPRPVSPEWSRQVSRASVLSHSEVVAESKRLSLNSQTPTTEDDRESVRSGYQRKYGNQDPTSRGWSQHKRHFFVLSSAGKPIYSRYGDESKLSSLMGVIQAIVSFFESEDDTIRSITAGSHKFVFSIKGPLYMLAVSSAGEPEAQLREQLGYLYNQILFTLTSTQLTRIFEQRINFDLRNLIGGTELFMDELTRSFKKNAGFFLGGSVQCLRMPSRLRQKVGTVLTTGAPKSLLFGILFAHGKLINLVRPRRHTLHPSDLHLLINMVYSSSNFRTAESWTPICLPRFNPRAFLHAYVCFLSPSSRKGKGDYDEAQGEGHEQEQEDQDGGEEEKEMCLVLLSPSKDAFFEMSEYSGQVVKALEEANLVEGVKYAMKSNPYSIVELGIPPLRHFVYKSRNLVQFTEPGLAPPYTSKSDWKRLFRMYQYSSNKMQKDRTSSSSSARVFWHVSDTEAVLCMGSSNSEIYAAFGPLTSKAAAQSSVQALQKWIKRHEEEVFLVNSTLL